MSNTCNAIDSGVTLSLYYICLSKAVLLHHITLKAYLNTQPFCLGTFMIMQQDSYTVFLLSDTTASTFFFFFFFAVCFSAAAIQRWRLFHWEAGG